MKKAKVVKIIKKSTRRSHLIIFSKLTTSTEQGKPTATILSIKGGPAVTLQPTGTTTVFAGSTVTIAPASQAKKDNGATSLTVSAVLFAKLFAVVGGAFGGALLVL